jgi:hypothetical protein
MRRDAATPSFDDGHSTVLRREVDDLVRSQFEDQRSREACETRICSSCGVRETGTGDCSTSPARSRGACRRERPACGSLHRNFRWCSPPRKVMTTYAAINNWTTDSRSAAYSAWTSSAPPVRSWIWTSWRSSSDGRHRPELEVPRSAGNRRRSLVWPRGPCNRCVRHRGAVNRGVRIQADISHLRTNAGQSRPMELRKLTSFGSPPNKSRFRTDLHGGLNAYVRIPSRSAFSNTAYVAHLPPCPRIIACQLSRAYLFSSHFPKRRFHLLMRAETIAVRRVARRHILFLFASRDGVKSVGSAGGRELPSIRDLPRDGCAREGLLEQRGDHAESSR